MNKWITDDSNNVDIGYLNIGCLKIGLFFEARLEACTKPIDAKTQAHDNGLTNLFNWGSKCLLRKSFAQKWTQLFINRNILEESIIIEEKAEAEVFENQKMKENRWR